METNIVQSIITLFQMICVIIVFAYLFTRSRVFQEILGKKPSFTTKSLLVVIFGLLSVYGTISGVTLYGAVLNVRDLGPFIAGLCCGPWVGIGAGIIGGLYRCAGGGPYMYTGLIAPILAGFIGGIMYLANKRDLVPTWVAVVLIALVESLVSLIAMLVATPASQFVTILTVVAIPMVITNIVAVFIFSTIIQNLISERKTRLEKEKLETEMARKNAELQIAAEIQRNFLPETLPKTEGFDIAAKSIPAKEVGGDFFDVIPLEVMPISSSRTGIMIADVSGKGVPAALFMALSRIVVRVTAMWFRKPSEVISFANPIIANNSKTGMFVTLFYGVIDKDTRTLTYVNAGHNPPIVLRKKTGEIEELTLTGMAVGALEDATYSQQEIPLAPGDVMVLYTDGITEAVNDREEMYDLPRLIETIRNNSNSSSKELADEIISSVFAFSGTTPQFDDITLMVVKAG
ncbi:MAG: SpoIIE family protein phosphatase [Methanoregula sp.]|jgi:sigma-B regulation protein RsbU (phosphoserine phosphatase)|uniref:SpoIIE family protein phosphatase n=1 Tax=Methanoregula sp. TaxID=2052170 RepID=UPI0025D0D44C|nr:SpoIIE family protein phosphatase [Methanoregula sp.]MCK9631468.1 SpoIIE family protein phosphatase [Methanoregula sp.]